MGGIEIFSMVVVKMLELLSDVAILEYQELIFVFVMHSDVEGFNSFDFENKLLHPFLHIFFRLNSL